MKKTCLITAMILMALMSTASYGVTPAGPLSVNGNRIVDQNDQPVSFAGVSFFWTNDGWGGSKYYNADCLNWLVSDWNVEIVRAAMGVEDGGGYLDSPTNNKDRVITVVDASIAAGIYVIIDWHSHHAEDYESEAIDFFEEMATTYGGYDNVIYEIYNEPLSDCSWPDDIKPYAEAVIAAIRAIDPDNLIVVGSPEWSQRVDLPAADPITGYINIAYTIHFYPDMGHTSWLRSRASAAMNDGIALMATEWGPKGYLEHEETTAWMDWCDLNYVSHTAWAVNDKDEPWSFLDPWIGMETGGWSEEDLSIRGQVVKDICLNWDDTPTPPPPPELVGHWKLDENQGSTAADSSTKGNDGSLLGDPQWVAGKYGSALTFDGAGDAVDLGNPSVLDFGTSDFTLCAWVKNPGGNNVIAKGGDQSGGIRYALQVGTTVQLLVDDNSDKTSVSGGSGLGDGEWHHVAGAKDGGVLRVYIDSGQVANGDLPYSPYDLSGTSQHNAYIGALWQHQDNMLGDFYTGSIDDARIYTWALSSGELAEVMGEDPNITPPAAPTGLTATAGDSQVSLDWDDNTEPDLAGYDVYRSTTSGGPYSVIDFDLTQSDYTDNSVSNGTTYYYVVTAVDTDLNESAYSNEDSATPTAGGGEGVYQESGGECVMEAENATVDQRSDNITWSSATGHSGYIGSSYMTPPDNTGTTVTWSTACELAWDVEISTAGTYYMAVRRIALDNGDDSARVGVGGSERDDNTFNGEATSWQWSRGTDFDLGSLSAGTHTIQIRRREDGFCVDRVMIADSWSKLPADGSTEAGPAENPTGGEPPDTTPPAAPTGLSASAGDATVSLDWNDNGEGDLDGYNVYRSTTSGSGYSQLNGSLVGSSDYTDNSASNGTTYYYVVTAVDTSSNESGYSNEDSATPTDTTPPAAPTGLAATAGDATVSLDWNDNGEGDLDGYNVFRSTTSGSGYSQLNGSLVGSSDYTDNSVSNDTTYYYVVTAVDTSSNESGYSNEASATPTGGGVVFSDSFENGEWNGLWTEDSQADWYDSTQRAVDGSYSAEVDGSASDAALTSIVIDLQGKTNATVTFFWLIEVQLDSGEYLAFDVSTNGGTNWVQKAILQGNVDPENTWHNANIDVTGISGGFQIRFRAKMSRSNEDANVDMVEVLAW